MGNFEKFRTFWSKIILKTSKNDQISEPATNFLNALYELAKILNMPIIVTEQYPKAFGHIVSEFKDVEQYVVCEKTMFTMWTPEVKEKMKSEFPHIENILMVGIETQACIMATTFDLLEENYDVHLLANCVSSRSQTDRLGGLKRMEKVGAYLTTAEAVLFQLLGDAKHPKFREASKFIVKPFVDTDIDTVFWNKWWKNVKKGKKL